MEWLDFVYGGDDGLSCFCLNLHIFSDGPIVMLEVKLYKPRGSCKIPSTTETGGLTFCGVGRPPLVGPIGWLGLQNIIIPSGGSARTENKDIQTRRGEGLSDRGSKMTARQPLWLQPMMGEERAGNRKWPVVCHWLCPEHTFAVVLFLQLDNRSNSEMMRKHLRLNSELFYSVSQGVPEETKATRVHMVWKRTPCSGSNMCGLADHWVFFLQFWKVA